MYQNSREPQVFQDSARFNETAPLFSVNTLRTIQEKKTEELANLDNNLIRRSSSLRKSISLRKLDELPQDKLQDDSSPTVKSFRQVTKETALIVQEGAGSLKARGEEKMKKISLKFFLKNKMESVGFNILIGIFINIALFNRDLSTAILSKQVELGLNIMSLIALIVLMIQIILSIYAMQAYRFSVMFWLDIASAITIVFQIDFINKLVIYPAFENTSAQKISIIAIIGLKISRIVRIPRLLCFLKCCKKYRLKHPANDFQNNYRNASKIYPEGLRANFDRKRTRASQFSDYEIRIQCPRESNQVSTTEEGRSAKKYQRVKQTTKESQYTAASEDSKIHKNSEVLENSDQKNHPKNKESKIGKKLFNITIIRTIAVALTLLSISPLFYSESYHKLPNHQEYQMKLLSSLIDSNSTENAKQTAIDLFIQLFEKETTLQLVYFSMGDSLLFLQEGIDIDELKWDQYRTINIMTESKGKLISIVSDKNYDRFDALLNIAKTFSILALLILAAKLFERNIKVLLLKPLETIMLNINKIMSQPLSLKGESFSKNIPVEFKKEVIQIEKAVAKIERLLTQGFGEAGSFLITKDISTRGDVDLMQTGKKVAAIYGFCNIRKLAEVTEILQEDVTIFVNSIMDIVHSVVDNHGGTVNQNNTDTFLVTWKLPEESIIKTRRGEFGVLKTEMVVNIVDCALISFLKIYARINRDPALLKFKNESRLNERLPNYKVKMGFGLHIGWSIEGAIGSQYKIDASYLSPNVNMASRLEAATKQYGVPLLFSDELYEMLSDSLQENSRMVDVVAVKESANPINLYTVNLDLDEMFLAKERANMPLEQTRNKQKKKKEYIKSLIESGLTYTLLETDKELKHMLRNKTNSFDELFDAGFSAYIDGKWDLARKNFDSCLLIRNNDIPTKNLIAFMGNHNYVAPDDWKGCRALMGK